MDYEQILLSIEDGVATITLNRPEKLNAFTGRMAIEWGDAFARCDEDDAVRAVVVTGAGRAFCAGADLSRGEHTFDGGARAHSAGAQAALAVAGAEAGVRCAERPRDRRRAHEPMQCDVRFVAEDAKLAVRVRAPRRDPGAVVARHRVARRRPLARRRPAALRPHVHGRRGR